MSRPSTGRLAAWLLPVLWACAAPAMAQVNTCLYADGTIVYSDKACASVGAEAAPDDLKPRLVPRYRNACARDVQALLIELSTAIEVGDANRLGAFYHWSGQSTRAGYDIMERLEAIAARPLLDIVPVYAEPEPTPGSLYYPPLDAHRPVAVRILQQSGRGGTDTSTTTLGLAEAAGCWWVRL